MNGRVFVAGFFLGALILTGPLCFVVGRYGADIETARAMVAAQECLRHEAQHRVYLEKFMGVTGQPVKKPAGPKRVELRKKGVVNKTYKPPRNIGG